ncbi:MAG TPA: PP2C family protein-serine/threonine phosphatase [Streptosporangiaceae bacterium]|nr:PP2C family protein-serine/threonine phosphatase [Streptosporangiaceae bacterium]
MTSEAIATPQVQAAAAQSAVPPVRVLGSRRLGSLAAQLAQERHVALELQHAILPLHDKPFDLPGLRAAVRYLPAARAGRVGGDWYITAEMPDGRVLLAIGDVGGHGLEAAAGMARLRGALAGLAFTGASPDRLVGWLNDLVWHVAPEHTASVIVGYFDPATRLLTWSQAGHPPPILVRGSWALPVDAPAGILLGAGPGGYELLTLQLRQDDLLLLYSDGLIERRYRSLDEGVAMLVKAVRGVADPERMISAALSSLGSADTDDDTCLVALAVR